VSKQLVIAITDIELVIYGSTELGAKVTIDSHEIEI
jgi:hypothetical protein